MQTALWGEASTKLPACTAPATCASLYKGVFGILSQPTGLRLFLSNWSCASLLWSIRTVPFRPIKLWGFGVHICMRMDKSGTKGRSFCPAPLALREHFPFLSKNEYICFPGWAVIPKMSHWSRAEQTNAGQSRLAQNIVDKQEQNRAASIEKNLHPGCLTTLTFS